MPQDYNWMYEKMHMMRGAESMFMEEITISFHDNQRNMEGVLLMIRKTRKTLVLNRVHIFRL